MSTPLTLWGEGGGFSSELKMYLQCLDYSSVRPWVRSRTLRQRWISFQRTPYIWKTNLPYTPSFLNIPLFTKEQRSCVKRNEIPKVVTVPVQSFVTYPEGKREGGSKLVVYKPLGPWLHPRLCVYRVSVWRDGSFLSISSVFRSVVHYFVRDDIDVPRDLVSSLGCPLHSLSDALGLSRHGKLLLRTIRDYYSSDIIR